MIPTFNCAKHLRKTLESVLAQDPGPDTMQIEVVDDCSTQDEPRAVVQDIGGERVSFFRNETNLGATANFNRCVDRSRGYWVHILHGDDYVMPGFYEAMREKIADFDNVSIAVCRAFFVDESGEIDGITPRLPLLENGGNQLPPIHLGNPIQTPSVVVKRSFYEKYGGFDSRLCHVADWEMWLRAFYLGGGVSINRPLACYRTFSGNDTSRLKKTGENIRDFLRFKIALSETGLKYDCNAFDKMCKTAALRQYNQFSQANDIESARSNLAVWRENANLKERLFFNLQLVKKIWFPPHP